MIRFSFIRAPFGEPSEPLALHRPELACEIEGDQLVLHVYGTENYELHEEFHGKTIPFEGQQTYDRLRSRYHKLVGSVFGVVDLQDAPRLHLEQTEDGWCVLKMGGAEYPHFDSLIDRVRAAGFNAKAVAGRAGFDAVAIEITASELAAFKKLEAVIVNQA